ncbi:hypothetical protein IW261DRAFT_1551124 [Armillaria novae-zelandiae]|uniref:Glucose-methanol-choline oxidoreductase N-terminal domain-containing protein n=1 Tax=Armillaria novae-zelandiae TaxID=153914 RepID=A0AA39PAU0_9AGAR|nr:hypothetical protein IW261DRAFT_1551124 [Armillaria novae-zelandiae]
MFFNQTSLIANLSAVGRKVDEESNNDKHGTAGCVLASRLSEDSSLSVLLLESGGSGKSLLYSVVPSAFSLLFQTEHVYQLYTEPQAFAQNKKKFWPSGKMLGGCSAINAEMAQYGVPGDFDKWVSITGDDSWSWNNFKHYFTKFETYTENADYPDVNMSNKGTKGPVRVGYFPALTKHSRAFIDACKSLGIPFSADFNTGESPTGVNRLMTYVDNKLERVTSETAYLTPGVLARPNLKVAIHAQVTKILVQKSGEEKRAYAVEFTNNRDGPVYRAKARKEVILSAGAIHSPQILMLSGIGPSEELEKFDIPVVHELQGVGGHLMDHPVIDCNLKDKTNTSPKYLKPTTLLDLIKYVSACIQYLLWRRGPAATNLGEAAAFVRTDDASVFLDSSEPLEDSTSSPSSPDIEIFTIAVGYQEHGMKAFSKHTFSLHSVLLQPLSIGSIRLKSLSPYLESEADVKKLVRGFKLCLKISETEPLAALLDQNCEDAELDHHQRIKNDAEIEEMIRSRVETLYHPTSTCRMAPLKEGGVVDVSFRVYGIQGLRVCDASIFPSIISGHTAGATFAVAEKLSDIMKRNSTESPSS